MLVTGLKWISDSFSVPFPQYMPLMVLHDPPGGMMLDLILFPLFPITVSSCYCTGLSMASYQNLLTKTSISVISSTVRADVSLLRGYCSSHLYDFGRLAMAFSITLSWDWLGTPKDLCALVWAHLSVKMLLKSRDLLEEVLPSPRLGRSMTSTPTLLFSV